MDTRSAANIEKAQITKKRGSNRTVADDVRLRELECFVSLYLDEEGAATFPAAALRTNIETAARKLRQGPQVREGLIVEEVEEFDYDRSLGTSPDELARNAQFHRGGGCGTCPGVCVPGHGSMIGRPLSGWMWTPNWWIGNSCSPGWTLGDAVWGWGTGGRRSRASSDVSKSRTYK